MKSSQYAAQHDRVWVGHANLKAEIDAGNITLTGDRTIARSMHDWLGLKVFAREKRAASAIG